MTEPAAMAAGLASTPTPSEPGSIPSIELSAGLCVVSLSGADGHQDVRRPYPGAMQVRGTSACFQPHPSEAHTNMSVHSNEICLLHHHMAFVRGVQAASKQWVPSDVGGKKRIVHSRSGKRRTAWEGVRTGKSFDPTDLSAS